MTSWRVLCDFDGTIATEDVIDTLLERYGRAGWRAIEDAWRAGRIGSRECLSSQTALLAMTRAQFESHLTQVDIDPGFVPFVDALSQRRVPLAIVSDGFEQSIRAILAHHGLPPIEVVANRIAADGAGWRLESPNAAAGCASGTCKCAVAARGLFTRTLMVGDGASDFCVAGRVDFVFAKGRLAAHCRSQGLPHVEVRTFDEINRLLPVLLDGGVNAVLEAARFPYHPHPLDAQAYA